jgi:hypothetical protein
MLILLGQFDLSIFDVEKTQNIINGGVGYVPTRSSHSPALRYLSATTSILSQIRQRKRYLKAHAS